MKTFIERFIFSLVGLPTPILELRNNARSSETLSSTPAFGETGFNLVL